MGKTQNTKKPCKLCQRSRWLMMITMLVMLAGVAVLNLGG